jgi:hypothetical protein
MWAACRGAWLSLSDMWAAANADTFVRRISTFGSLFIKLLQNNLKAA